MTNIDENSKNTVFINSKGTPENLVDDKSLRKKAIQIYGLTGIVNTNNTCYMNSAIQAFSHNYPLTSYLFEKKNEILETLIKNGRKILKDTNAFKIETEKSIVPLLLRNKIQDPNYDPKMMTEEEINIILNNTITGQLIKLLEHMWKKNCTVVPTSFKKIFSEARDKFFFGYEQHDAEEAYSCILQKMQEELAEEKNIKFKITKPSVQEFLQFKNDITMKINNSQNIEEKKQLLELYKKKKREMFNESLTIEAFREMKKYYGTAYSKITEIFSGFLHSSLTCPDPNCGYSSNKFDPFLHLSLSIPNPFKYGPILTIQDCMHDYFKEETLDEKNLWMCEGCNKKVCGIKKLQLWTGPPILVIQLKRFGNTRNSKDNRLVKYPTEHFDISSVMSSVQFEPSKCFKYRLQCVINHTGSLNSGHYYTYCLDEDSGKWYEFNDHLVSEIDKNRIVTNTAYLLFYIREDMIINL